MHHRRSLINESSSPSASGTSSCCYSSCEGGLRFIIVMQLRQPWFSRVMVVEFIPLETNMDAPPSGGLLRAATAESRFGGSGLGLRPIVFGMALHMICLCFTVLAKPSVRMQLTK